MPRCSLAAPNSAACTSDSLAPTQDLHNISRVYVSMEFTATLYTPNTPYTSGQVMSIITESMIYH